MPYAEQPQVVVTHKENCDPERGKSLEDEDGSRFLLLALHQLQAVHNKGLHAVDGRSETKNLPGDCHGRPHSVSLADGAGEVVVEMGLGVDPQLVGRSQVLGKVLDETAELDGEEGTFSRQGVCLRKRMREARTFSNDVIKGSIISPINPTYFI